MDPLTAGLIMGGGALGSGLSSMFGADQTNKNLQKGLTTIGGIQQRVPGQVQQVTSGLQDAYSPYTQGAAADMSAYRSGLGQVGNLQYGAVDPFAYDLQAGTQQFLDPLMDAKIESATKNLQSSAANRGGLFSSATGRSTAEQAAEMKGAGWKDAMEMALRDRGFQYGVYGDDIKRDRQNIDLALDQQRMKLQGLGNLAGIGERASTNLASKVADTQMGGFQAINEADLAKANLQMQKQDPSFLGNLGNFIGGGASALGSIMGGK